MQITLCYIFANIFISECVEFRFVNCKRNPKDFNSHKVMIEQEQKSAIFALTWLISAGTVTYMYYIYCAS